MCMFGDVLCVCASMLRRTYQISLPHAVSTLSWFLIGDDRDHAYAQAATSAPNTLLLFI